MLNVHVDPGSSECTLTLDPSLDSAGRLVSLGFSFGSGVIKDVVFMV